MEISGASFSINCDKAKVLLLLNFLRTEGLFSQISQIGRFGFPSAFLRAHMGLGEGHHWGINNTCNSIPAFVESFL